MKTINSNSIITARFITDSNLRQQIKVVDRKKSFAFLLLDGQIVKRKIQSDSEKEYVFPYGKYSMAPIAY